MATQTPFWQTREGKGSLCQRSAGLGDAAGAVQLPVGPPRALGCSGMSRGLFSVLRLCALLGHSLFSLSY